MPGFPRALSRTLGELRMAAVDPAQLTGHAANDDLAALLARAIEERQRVGAVDYATMLATATAELQANPQSAGGPARWCCSTSRLAREAEAAFIQGGDRLRASRLIVTTP